MGTCSNKACVKLHYIAASGEAQAEDAPKGFPLSPQYRPGGNRQRISKAAASLLNARFLNSNVCCRVETMSGASRCRGPTTAVPSLGHLATGQQCTDCFHVTRNWLIHDGGAMGLGLRDEDSDLLQGTLITRWAPGQVRVMRNGAQVASTHTTPDAPEGAPFQWGCGIQGLPMDQLQLPVIAGRLEHRLSQHDAQGWHWLCGFCLIFKQFFFYQYGPDGQTGAAQWFWPDGARGSFQVPVAVK